MRAIFPLKIVLPVMFALQLFINLCVVAARLLIMAKHDATLLLAVESIWGLRKKGTALKVFLCPLGTILIRQVIVPLLRTFVS